MRGRLFCYYGDDFTGSTDALEALAANAVPSVLFLDPPDERDLARFADCRAIGVAGESRSRGPEWMSEHLPEIFRSLKRLGAPLCQYKVCSTFDSSPEHGSIGRAIEIGLQVFQNPYVPIVVAAPHLGRYVLFGNLFAAGEGAIHRIDRHPTMRRHPVTPMDESDLRLHLARQTDRRIALLDILALHGSDVDFQLDQLLAGKPGAVLFDGLDRASLLATGRLIGGADPLVRSRPPGRLSGRKRPTGASAADQGVHPTVFAVGSSGLTYALIEYWRSAGLIPPDPTPGALKPVDRLIVISGSCSPATERQIRRAVSDGFAGIRIDAAAPEQSLDEGLAALSQGSSVALYTALGPQDCAGALRGEELGCRLGILLRKLLLRSGVRRAVIAGGDTSSHSVRRLGIHALTYAAQLAPGVPLCRGHSGDPSLDGLELALKGGQVGGVDFFEKALRGKT
jgi:3-oxoisoapionate kinase